MRRGSWYCCCGFIVSRNAKGSALGTDEARRILGKQVGRRRGGRACLRERGWRRRTQTEALTRGSRLATPREIAAVGRSGLMKLLGAVARSLRARRGISLGENGDSQFLV